MASKPAVADSAPTRGTQRRAGRQVRPHLSIRVHASRTWLPHPKFIAPPESYVPVQRVCRFDQRAPGQSASMPPYLESTTQIVNYLHLDIFQSVKTLWPQRSKSWNHAQASTSLLEGRHTREQAHTLQSCWNAAAIALREAVAGLGEGQLHGGQPSRPPAAPPSLKTDLHPASDRRMLVAC